MGGKAAGGPLAKRPSPATPRDTQRETTMTPMVAGRRFTRYLTTQNAPVITNRVDPDAWSRRSRAYPPRISGFHPAQV